MPENIAILIGNTSYQRLEPLPCCANDVREIRKLLEAANKFDQIVQFVDQPVAKVKDQLKELAKEKNSTDELFFYFTGHGTSDVSGFYMCFDAFDESAPNRSGLSRDEAYEILREFSPRQTVVTIDACESGGNLIKDTQHFLKTQPKAEFTDFIQFASCTSDQNSRGGSVLSRFTDAFIEAAISKEDGPVYYSDITNGLKDAFKGIEGQTPHFVTQGTGLAEFCSDASYLAELREAFLSIEAEPLEQDTSPEDSFDSALSVIHEIERKIPDEVEAQNFVDSVFSSGFESEEKLGRLNDLFDLRFVKYNDYNHVQNKKLIYRILASRNGRDTFVEAEEIEVKSPEEERNSLSAFGTASLAATAFWSRPPREYTYRLSNRCDLSSVHVGIYFEPKLKVLNRVFSEVVFLPRLTECLVLTANSIQARTGWNSFKQDSTEKDWKWSVFDWTSDPDEVATRQIKDPFEFAMKYVLSFERTEKQQKESKQ